MNVCMTRKTTKTVNKIAQRKKSSETAAGVGFKTGVTNALNALSEPRLGDWSVFDLAVLLGCILTAALMYLRATFGTEFTDEAYYVADALGMVRGNLPYAFDNFSVGTGCAFLLIPPIAIYQWLVPDCSGLFLFTRICFVTFQLAVAAASFVILRKHVRISSALLFAACFLPYYAGGILNFSYNTVPATLFPLIAVLSYDAAEGDCSKRGMVIRLAAAGFMSGVAVFANPAYSLAVLILLALILIRSVRSDRIRNTAAYIAGGVLEILVVFLPIIAQTGWNALWSGLHPMFFHDFVSESMQTISRSQIWAGVIRSAFTVLRQGFIVFAVVLLFSVKLRQNDAQEIREPDKRDAALFALSISVLALIALGIARRNHLNEIYSLGILGTLCILAVLPSRVCRKFPLIYYLGIYPIAVCILQVAKTATDAGVSRFSAAVPVLFALLLFLNNNEKRSTRCAAVLGTAACILLTGYISYQNIYRDASIYSLTARVETGVYQGIRTTPQRAEDLPVMEQCVNLVVEDGAWFAARDNAPFCYLMAHNGRMCDITSWDALQYTYHRNLPAALFDYYRRRGAIPDVIIYVDTGRDPQLSLDDETFRFNDFVNTYYTCENDLKLSSTFPRFVSFRSNGTFDGDYDYWINTYNSLP